MGTDARYIHTRKFQFSTVVWIMWMAFPGTLFFFLRGTPTQAAILFTCGVFVLVAAIDGRVIRSLEGRRIDRNRAVSMMIGWVNLILLILAFLYISITTFQNDLLILSLYTAGAIILVGLSAWFLISSKAQKHHTE